VDQTVPKEHWKRKGQYKLQYGGGRSTFTASIGQEGVTEAPSEITRKAALKSSYAGISAVVSGAKKEKVPLEQRHLGGRRSFEKEHSV